MKSNPDGYIAYPMDEWPAFYDDPITFVETFIAGIRADLARRSEPSNPIYYR